MSTALDASTAAPCVICTWASIDIHNARDLTLLALIIRSCEAVVRLGIPFVVVDSSPDAKVFGALSNAGAVVQRSRRCIEANDAEMRQREAISAALRFISSDGGVLAFQTMGTGEEVALGLAEAANRINPPSGQAQSALSAPDVVLLRRSKKSWESFCPQRRCIEEYASLHLDKLARHSGLLPLTDNGLDWTFGSFAFRKELAHHFLSYDDYDAFRTIQQIGGDWPLPMGGGGLLFGPHRRAALVPLARAFKCNGANVKSLTIDYQRPPLLQAHDSRISAAWGPFSLPALQLLFAFLEVELPPLTRKVLKCKHFIFLTDKIIQKRTNKARLDAFSTWACSVGFGWDRVELRTSHKEERSSARIKRLREERDAALEKVEAARKLRETAALLSPTHGVSEPETPPPPSPVHDKRLQLG